VDVTIGVRHAPRLTARERELVRAVVGVLLPDFPILPDDVRGRVEQDVAAFLGAQIAGLPTPLRMPYRLALAALGGLPVLRYGRPFTRLEHEQRVRWLDLWQERGGLATASVLKLLRSCALFAYFDHPLVTEQLEADAAGRAVLAKESG
jgi:hypothetical protein